MVEHAAQKGFRRQCLLDRHDRHKMVPFTRTSYRDGGWMGKCVSEDAAWQGQSKVEAPIGDVTTEGLNEAWLRNARPHDVGSIRQPCQKSPLGSPGQTTCTGLHE